MAGPSTILYALILSIPLGVAGLEGQTTPSFEVISVRPTAPERQNILRPDYCTAGGRFSVGGIPVMWSLTYAYRLRDYQISNAPAWLNAFDSAYDIEARPSSPVDEEQCRLMVQSMFAERFKLKTHRETKEAAVYLLTVASGGSKLREGGGVRLNGSVQFAATGKPQWPDGWTTSRLAVYLSDVSGRPVVDRTGLTGTYGITLNFSRVDGDNRPSVFTAVQDDLGLKLEAGKAPIEMLVIDQIEKATPN